MAQASGTSSKNQPAFLWANRRIDLYAAAAIGLSLLVHLLFIYLSQNWQAAAIHTIEKEVETLFNVRLADLESRNFISRPTQEQLQIERERALNEQMRTLAALPERSAESTLSALSPDLRTGDAPPSLDDVKDEDMFVDDQAANNLITTDSGDNAVGEFEERSGQDVDNGEVESKRIALTGRGTGRAARILSDLPAPVLDENPIASRTISVALKPDLAPSVPKLELEEPPIELPPVTELLPSPDLIRPSPIQTTLRNEQIAIQKIQDRFIQLDDLIRIDLFTYHHVGGEGYFMIRIRPQTTDERLQILPKDIVLVLDASASMGRLRINVVKKEIHNILERLRPGDRFNVVGFKQSVQKFTDTFVEATPGNVESAWDFIRPLRASGRTDIYKSLEPLVQLGTERARPLIMLLFSDGRPTAGDVNSKNIISNLSRYRGPSTSIFCIGTGEKLNRYLLDMLAHRNRGRTLFERDRDELSPHIQAVYGYIEDPVLLRIQADFVTVDPDEIYPKQLPDLYMKGELQLWGRLKDEKKISVRVVGEAFDEQKEFVFELPVPDIDNATYEIAREWALRKIYHLMDQMVEAGNQSHYLQEIETLTRTYRVMAPYMNNQ